MTTLTWPYIYLLSQSMSADKFQNRHDKHPHAYVVNCYIDMCEQCALSKTDPHFGFLVASRVGAADAAHQRVGRLGVVWSLQMARPDCSDVNFKTSSLASSLGEADAWLPVVLTRTKTSKHGNGNSKFIRNTSSIYTIQITTISIIILNNTK